MPPRLLRSMIRCVLRAGACTCAAAAPALAQRPAAHALDTVQVTSRTTPAAESTRSVEVVTREDLGRRAGRSLAELLGQSLGIDALTRSPAQADVAIRGSSFNQVVVLVDGVRVSDVQSGHYALDLAVPVAMIDRIEILRGGAAALYGSDAVGGIVNIVTRADIAAASLALRGGSWGGASGSATGAAGGGDRAMRVGADVDRSDGHRPGKDFRVAQARAAGRQRTRAGRLVADIGQGVRHFGAARFYSPFNSDETTRSTTASLRLVPNAGRRLSVGGALHLRHHTDLFTLKRDDPAYYQNQHTSRETGGEVIARAALTPALTAAAGIEQLDARLRSARLGDHVQGRTGAFGELTLLAPGHAVIDAGIRRDALSDEGSFVSPSVAFSLPLRGAQVRASAQRGFRAPNWTERFYVDPANVSDSALAVERFVSREVGVRAPFSGALTADVAYYERRATDLIDWARPVDAPAGTPWRTRNFAAALYRGVEATLRAPDLLGVDWSLRASGLRFDASASPGLAGKYALRPVTRAVGVSAGLRPWPNATLTIDGQHSRRAGEAGHVLASARLSTTLRDLTPSVEMLNITGADFPDVTGRPVAGRSVFAGVSWAAR